MFPIAFLQTTLFYITFLVEVTVTLVVAGRATLLE
jgi:hypothetical protein